MSTEPNERSPKMVLTDQERLERLRHVTALLAEPVTQSPTCPHPGPRLLQYKSGSGNDGRIFHYVRPFIRRTVLHSLHLYTLSLQCGEIGCTRQQWLSAPLSLEKSDLLCKYRDHLRQMYEHSQSIVSLERAAKELNKRKSSVPRTAKKPRIDRESAESSSRAGSSVLPRRRSIKSTPHTPKKSRILADSPSPQPLLATPPLTPNRPATSAKKQPECTTEMAPTSRTLNKRKRTLNDVIDLTSD